MDVKKFAALTLSICFFALSFRAVPGFADDAAQKRAELDNVQSQMQQMQERKEDARRRAEAASADLQAVQGNLNAINAQSIALRKKSRVLQEKIDENEVALAQKQQEVDQRKSFYSKRLREIYIHGQVNYLDVLLGAGDFGDFSTRMYLLQKIISRDLAMLEQLQKDAAEIEERKEQLASQMQEIRTNQAELAAQKARADKLREKRAQMLYKAQEDEQQSQSEYERLLAISENIAAMLKNMESSGSAPVAPPSTDAGSKMMWPCSGEITSYYGWRTHPIFGTTKYHSGMDIAVDYGTPIQAAASGTIIYSGWMGGYGNCVMIDHGGGLVTLYAHNDSVTMAEGQYVTKGTVVAYAGSTGYSTGPHCHFEVRLHGEVTEPLNYLP